jgi:hypothetical protein
MTDMDDLAAFLRARLDEDEAEVMRMFDFDRGNTDSQLHISDSDELVITGGRMLREVDAKRQLMALHQVGHDPCDAHDADSRSIPCEVIELLALPYVEHPDYRPERAPSLEGP